MRTVETMNSWSEPSTSSSRQTCFKPFGSCHLQTGVRPSSLKHIKAPRRSAIVNLQQRGQGNFICKSDTGTGNEKGIVQTTQDDRIKQTLADLDALLGIEEEDKTKKDSKKQANKDQGNDRQSGQSELSQITFSKDVIDAISKAEAERISQGKSDSEREQKEKDISEKMARIVENARKMSESNSRVEGSAGVEREMQDLFTALLPDTGVNRKHQQRIKEKVFGPTSFYVTEIRPLSSLRVINLNSPSASNQDLIQSSILVRGNLRAPKDEVFDRVCTNLQEEFGGEYTALMVTDPEAEELDAKGGPRVAFQIASSAVIQPQDSKSWQRVLAVVLGGLTLATVLQVGLTANISQLPKEIVEFFAQPDGLKGELPAELENYDALPFLLSAVPISLSVLGVQLAHEIGHKAVAATRKLKLGLPVLLPNTQIGCFGGITQLKSLARNRTDLFDVAAAGPAAGGLISAALFTGGLVLSKSSAEGLLPVPGALLDGSLLLGSLAHLVLGDAASSTTVNIHPLLIAGWCGLTSTALNCLPVGCLDGGRIMMAAFGRNLLGVTSFFTYLGLGLGFLGSGLALPFGIFVLLCQRDPEKYLQDTVTPPSDSRQRLATAILVAAALILLPMLPGTTDLGPGNFL